ncbi:MAG: sulfite exporter TauE/SafE family protein [Solirubrobacteraceae bacterium]|nr:sulfite exporter TauE/SafE family protein [Solirubrobacteraceae bacterium]
MDPLIVLFGLGVGVLVGMTGIGGGSLMAPLLILGAGVSPVVAIGTDLMYGAITKTVGGWRHLKAGTVDLGLSRWLAFGSVPGSLVGVFVLNHLHRTYGDDFDPVLLTMVAIMLLVVAGAILFRVLFLPGLSERERETVTLTRTTKTLAVSIGLVIGFLLGMTSVGSGALIGLALILIFRMTPHRVVGTDVFHAAILLWTAGLAHWFSGNVDWVLTANILIGSIPGVWAGTHFMQRVPANGLRPALGCVLLGSALAVLNKAGVDVPVAVIIGAPLAAGALAFVIHRLRPTPTTTREAVATA